MKKLLTILTLALALCLLCGAALAANEEFMGVMSEAEYLALVGKKAAEGTPKEFTIAELEYADLAKLHTAMAAEGVKCGGNYLSARVFGTPDGDGNKPTAIVYVKKDHKDITLDTAKTTAATCTEKGHNVYKCSECGYNYTDAEALAKSMLVEVPALGHDYQVTVTKEPTCDEKGEKVTKCTRCGAVLGDPEAIDTIAHHWVDVIVEKATCKSEGVVYWNCENCGGNYEVVWLGQDQPVNHAASYGETWWKSKVPNFDYHNWDEWSEKVPATCVKVAQQYRKCNLCTAEQYRDDPSGKLADHKIVIDTPEANWICNPLPTIAFHCGNDGCTKTGTVTPVNDGNGNFEAVCKIDTTEKTIYMKHKYELSNDPAKTHAATCTEAGKNTYVCAYGCGIDKVETTDEALGHLWGEWELKTAPNPAEHIYGHWQRKCTRPGCIEKEDYVDYDAPKATCPEGEHVWTLKSPSSIDCDVVYATVVFRCEKCNIEKTENNYKREHDYSIEVAVSDKASCVAEGSKVVKCQYCGDLQIVSIPMIDHQLTITHAAKDPTCVDVGNDEYLECAICNQLFDLDGNLLAGVPEIPATGVHTWDKEEPLGEEKCLEKAKVLKYCKFCDATEIEEKEVVPHKCTLVAPVIANCVAGGSEVAYYCDRCDKFFADAEMTVELPDGPVATEIDPANHAEELWHDEGKEPTCIGGWLENWYCPACEKWFLDEEGLTESAEEDLWLEPDPFNHEIFYHEEEGNALYFWDNDEPTCTSEGWVDEWYCPFCDRVFIDEAGTIESTWENAHLDPIPHNPIILVSETEATCKADGLKVYKCEWCDYLESETVPFEGTHTLVKVEGKAATCKDTGLKEAYKCSVCDKLFADAEGKTEIAAQEIIDVDASAHVWGDVIVTKAATCEEAGAGLKVCSVCNLSESVVIDAIGHDWGEWEVTTPATVEKDGEETRVCKIDATHKETRTVKFVPTDPAKYEVKDLDYTNPVATGSIELDPSTKALTKAYARVTFFVANGDCMIQIVDVDEAGNFTAGAIGNFTHVSVIIVDDADAYGAEEAIEHAHGNGGIEL